MLQRDDGTFESRGQQANAEQVLRAALVAVLDSSCPGESEGGFTLEQQQVVIVTLRQFAAASRGLGRKPKQMLTDLRRVIADIAPEVTDRRIAKLQPRAAAIDETIQWCIARYYRHG